MNPTPLLDLFDIESLWNEEQCMVRDNVRRFARNEFAPGVAEWYINETFPDEPHPISRITGRSRRQFNGLWLRRPRCDSLWLDHAGTRVC